MKRCTTCDQIVSEKIITCPACGSHIVEGMKYIDDYRIQAIIHEGRSSIVCKAIKDDAQHSVSIRLFTEKSGVDDKIAQRLEQELTELKKLPAKHFVQHYALKQSHDGHWYRLSEWVHAMDWGSIFMSGMLNDQRKIVTLFHNIASVLELLHQQDHFMPYLILEDILIPKKKADELHVKINYKLSRFLNARATHHGPMLQKLLNCHPDIINERAIDFKSGIWSLGKIFVELLTADPNIKDYAAKLDSIKGLDPDLLTLIKLMLSDDPSLRPQTMGRVVSALGRILNRLPYTIGRPAKKEKKPALIRELQWFKRVVVVLMFIIFGMAAFGGISWFRINTEKNKTELTLAQFVESYASSVAFLMVEYKLSQNDRVIYKNHVEGTAFLADERGYLLTNRHVACPWLEDTNLFKVYAVASQKGDEVIFDYNMHLWFEGTKAFNRLLALKNSTDPSDTYHLSSAYSTGGEGNLRIVGIPRSKVNTGQLMKSPFRNDYAVLKIDNLPDRLKPLPLENNFSPERLKRLSPVVILGFPLGNRTQADYINTSITRGHVRRTTKEIIQVDTSIYSGNSGGPAIDESGRVIGIASGVVTDSTKGYIKIDTPLSDFGLVLPIYRPAALINSIKKGHPQWNGVIDFSLDTKLEKINELALENKFKEATELAESMLKQSNDPILIYVAGMLNFCSGNLDQSNLLFKKLSMIEHENANSRLMLYIIDWIRNNQHNDSFTKLLFEYDWQDDNEYLGYLARVLRDKKQMSPDLIEYENGSEKSWRLFIEGLILEKNNAMDLARNAFRASILSSHHNDWVYYLSYSRLNQIQQNMLSYLENKTDFQKQIDVFSEQAKKQRELSVEVTEKINTLIEKYESGATEDSDRMAIHKELSTIAPENRSVLGKLAFYHASAGDWETSIEKIDTYFAKPIRQTALSLSLGLLKGQLLKLMGRDQEAQTFMNAFSETIQSSWYKLIIKHIMDSPDKAELIKLAGNKPAKLITLHTALGLWSEAQKDNLGAAHHYREALSSYLEDWSEYHLALGRVTAIRKAAN